MYWRSPRNAARWMAVALLAVGTSNCDSPTAEVPDSVQLSVHLTDAPGDVRAVWVDISDIRFTSGPDGAVPLRSEATGLVELTSLVGRTMELASALPLAAGTYGELRLRVSAAVLETTDGEVYAFGDAQHPGGLVTTGTLRCPSCTSSGIKVKLPVESPGLMPGSHALILDFDVRQSFGRVAGKSGAWVMRPVVIGTLSEGGVGQGAGRIVGTVALDTDSKTEITIPACPAGQRRSLRDFVPTATAQAATANEPVVKSGATLDDGSFAIEFVEPGAWGLGYVSEVTYGDHKLVFSASVTPSTVQVAGQAETRAHYVVHAVECERVSSPPSAGNPTWATVFLTDAPGDAVALWIDVDRVYFQGGPQGRHVLLDDPTGLVEVSALVERVQEISGRENVQPGQYSGLRVGIRAAVLETEAGEVLAYGSASHPGGLPTTGPLSCPRCAESDVLVLTGDLALDEGEANGIVLDFDVRQSLARNGGVWSLEPVIHATRTWMGDGDETSLAGGVAGEIVGRVGADVEIPSCPAGVERSAADLVPVARAHSLTDVHGRAVTRTGWVDPESGRFSLRFLETDTYALEHVADVEFEGWTLKLDAVVTPSEIHVTRGAAPSEVEYRITGARCEPAP